MSVSVQKNNSFENNVSEVVNQNDSNGQLSTSIKLKEFLDGSNLDNNSIETNDYVLFKAIKAFEDLNLHKKEHENSGLSNGQNKSTTIVNSSENLQLNSSSKTSNFEQHSLKRNLERSTQKIYREYLNQLERLNKVIIDVESSLAVSSNRCYEIGETVKSSYETALDLSNSLASIEALRKTNETRCAEVQAFLDKYTLPQEDMLKLQNPSQSVDQSFLDLVYKLRKLEFEALGLKNQGETLGQDILNALIACRSSADYRLEEYLYSRLKLAVDIKFRLGSLEPDSLVQQVILALGSKNKKWVNDLVNARLEHLREAFTNALTQGPKPIDLYIADSCRYVGDMLTWVHQLIVEEKDFYFNLFSINTENKNTAIYEKEYNLTSRLPFVFSSLNKSVHGVFESLSERIEYVMHGLEGPALAFQIAKSIQIHGDLFLKKLDIKYFHSNHTLKSPSLDSEVEPNSVPNEYIKKFVDFAQEAFYQILEDDMAQLLATSDLPPDDLNVPSSVQSTLNDLIKIISHPEIQDPGRVINTVLNPLIQLCDRDASFVAPNESAIYVINFLSYIQNVLSPYDTASNHIDAFTSVINRNLELLVELEHEALMKITNLEQLMPITDAYHFLLSKIMNEDGNENSVEEFISLCVEQNLGLVISGLQQIEQFLYTVDLDQDFTKMDSNDDGDEIGLKRLKLPTKQVWGLRNQALKLFISSYCTFYPLADRIFSFAKAKADKDDSINALLKLRLRPVAELETLLGL